ncbi:MAG: hypothetical protein LUD79_09370 [Oscillospiraceae bacterium]|nr:hypothetical protein [Oscillospiraceae bacterium]
MYLTERLNSIPLYTEDFIPLCFLLIVICLLEWCIPRRLGYRSTVSHQLLKIVFAIYLLVLFEMTVSLESLWLSYQAGFPIKGQQMLTPFREIRNFWFYGSKEEILVNLKCPLSSRQ